MNTDIIHFQISAPASLSIFGEHAKNRLRASIDLRTTLIFREVPASLSDDIEINFPRINLLHKIPLKIFLNFYELCVKNMELLHEKVLLFTFQYESINQNRFLQIFYYLIVFIMYKEQIEIKSFIMLLTTQLISRDGEFMSLTSLKVCLAACFLHWSNLQKGSHSTLDETDLKKICVYAKFDKIVPKSDMVDIIVCTYGSVLKYEKGQSTCKLIPSPSMTILLVDSNHTQDVEVQEQRVAELRNMFPEFTNFILNNFDAVTNKAHDAFETIFNFYKNDELSIVEKKYCLLLQRKTLEVSHNMNFIKKCCSVVCLCIAAFSVSYFFILRISTSSQNEFSFNTYFPQICIRKNHRLLQMLDLSNVYLDKICKLAQKHGLSGKYTEFGNGRYVYIWYTFENLIFVLMNELKTRGFDVIQTNLFCTGVEIG